jgi:hypothetical protein
VSGETACQPIPGFYGENHGPHMGIPPEKYGKVAETYGTHMGN